jgi:hypothetical protein
MWLTRRTNMIISLSSKYNDVISFVSYSIMLVLLVSHISLSSKYNDVTRRTNMIL